MVTDDSLFEQEQTLTGGGRTFFKFDKVGAKAVGTLVSSSIRSAENDFPEKKEYTLDSADGPLIVGIYTAKSWVIEAADKANIGDRLTFELVGFGGKNGKAQKIEVKLAKLKTPTDDGPAKVADDGEAATEDLEF